MNSITGSNAAPSNCNRGMDEDCKAMINEYLTAIFDMKMGKSLEFEAFNPCAPPDTAASDAGFGYYDYEGIYVRCE